MTYLQLINRVLVRLREPQVNSGNYASDPFYLSIGAFVNDAKLELEDAWQWSMNRGTVDITVLQGESVVEIPDSFDNNYQINSILVLEKANYLSFATVPWMQAKYSDDLNNPVQQGNPGWWAWYLDAANGNRQIKILQPPNADYTFRVYFKRRSPELVASDDVLTIPSLPVYQLATALSSVERGEVGGMASSDRFGIAKTALSDAIAYDSAMFPEEMDWWSMDRLTETNVKGW